MKNIAFNYIPYNSENKNYLHSKIKELSHDEKNLIIVQSEADKNFFNTVINENELKKKNNILSFDSFMEKIFFTDKYVLRDIKRFMIFYLSLEQDIKDKFNIKTYHDSIELANEFFEFFSNEEMENQLKNIELSKWQKEKLENFYIIKNKLDNLLKNDSYLPIDWLNKIENLDLYFLNDFKKIIFFDVVDFPENFKNILDKIYELAKLCPKPQNNLEYKNFEINIEIFLQIQKGDFNEKEFKLEKISYIQKDNQKNIKILKYKNEFEIFPHIKKDILESNTNFYSPSAKINDSYSLFDKSNLYLFNDSKLYKIIESYKNLVDIADYSNGESINLFRFKENIFTPAFMEFYGLDIEDLNTFNNLIENDFIYINLKKLEANYFDYYFKDGGERNYNLEEKLKEILKNISEIKNIKNINDLNEYFKENFFNSEENINFFVENKFPTIYDMFYEILGLLNTSENMMFFKNFETVFKKDVGKNLFLLFFNHLNNITLYSELSNENNETAVLKNLYSIKNLALDVEDENVILNLTASSLLKIKSKYSFLTEAQKKKLNLKTREDSLLIEKYRLYQNLISLKKIKFYLLYDLENNIDFSSFVYEFIEHYGYEEEKLISAESFLKSFYENYTKKEGDCVSMRLSPVPAGLEASPQTPEKDKSNLSIPSGDMSSTLPEEKICDEFLRRSLEVESSPPRHIGEQRSGRAKSEKKDEEVLLKKEKKYRAFKKEKSDFLRKDKDGIQTYQLRIGAYDYETLKENETFFFLKNICGLDPIRDTEEIDGFSAKTLGIILHKTLENIFKNKWKEIINSTEKIILSEDEILKYLQKTLINFELKIEFFINSYFKEIIIPRIIKNISVFLNFLYKEIKENKLTRIEAEKKGKTEHKFLKSQNGVEVILTGRADLVIESDKARYIIDFKTGKSQKDQLSFYAVMLYGKDKSLPIFTANYNFWDDKNKKIDFKEIDLDESNTEIKETILKFLENENYVLPSEKDLKENDFSFNQFHNYKRLCKVLDGDENEK